MLRVGWMGPEEHQRRRSTVARVQRRWRARAEWWELNGVIASGSRGAAASRRQGGGDKGVEASGEGESGVVSFDGCRRKKRDGVSLGPTTRQ
jgi:hypothetical protein